MQQRFLPVLDRSLARSLPPRAHTLLAHTQLHLNTGCQHSTLTTLTSPGPAEFGGSVDAESLLEFVDQGGDLLLAVDARASDELRGLVADFGVDLEKGHQALDFQSSAELRGDHDRTLVSSSSYGAAGALFGGQAPEVGMPRLGLLAGMRHALPPEPPGAGGLRLELHCYLWQGEWRCLRHFMLTALWQVRRATLYVTGSCTS